MLVGQQDLGALAIPGQGRRHQGFAMGAEVAPVIFVFVIDDQAVGQPGVAERPGGVQAATAAVLARAVGRAAHGQGGGLLQLRLLADHVDHPARVLDAVEQRGRPLEHFDPLSRGVQGAALHHRHAIAHDRAVAVVAKTPQQHRILGAAQGVGLGDAADVLQRVVQVARDLVLQDLGRDHVDDLRDFLVQRLAARHRGGGRRLVAGAVVGPQGGDAGGAQVQAGALGQRFEDQGAGIAAPVSEPGTAQQALQGLLGPELAIERRRLDAIGRIGGVDHADTGDPGEIAQRLGQWLGGNGEVEERAVLGTAGFGRQGHAQGQQRQPRHHQRGCAEPTFYRSVCHRICPGLHA